MIEIYRRAEGKDRLAGIFNNIEELFRIANEDDLKAFGYNPIDRTNRHFLFGELRDSILGGQFFLPSTRSCYVAYDNDKLITPDRLVGLYRAWRRRPWRNRYRRWRCGPYGSFRTPRTTQERRWAHAWDDEDFAPKNGFARGRRSNHNLPNAWDDYYSHADRSWKTQTKRRHQWKD